MPHRFIASLALALGSLPAFGQAVDVQFKLQAEAGVRSTNKNFIPPSDDAPFWHLCNNPASAVDASLVFSAGVNATFNLACRVSDPEGRELTLTEPIGDWPTGCTPNYTTMLVSCTGMTASTGSVTVRATDPAPASNATDQAFSWEVINPADTTAPTTPGTPTLIVRNEFDAQFSWTASTDASGIAYYEVYSCGPSPCTPSVLNGTSTLTTYTASVNQASSTPSYSVKAFDTAGNASATSGVLAAGAYSGGSPPSADYTVCDAGCNYTPAQIATLVGVTVAGDIVELRSTPQGTTDTWTASIDLDGETGTPNNEITYRVRDGDSLIVDNATMCLSLTGVSYVIVNGTDSDRSGLACGDVTDWTQASGGRSYNQNYAAYLNNSSYVQLKNLTLYGGSEYSCSQFERDSHHIVLDNVWLELCGTNNDPGVNKDRGDSLDFQPYKSIVKNSLCTHGGHNCINSMGPWQVFRNNEFDGYWGDKGTSFPGARSFVLLNGHAGQWIPDNVLTTSYGMVLVEDNTIERADASVDVSDQAAMKTQGFGAIIRENYFWDTGGALFLGPGYGARGSATGQVMSRTHVYNNTSWNSEGVFYNQDGAFTSAWGVANQQESRSKNNLWAGLILGPEGREALHVDADEAGATAMLNGYANSFKGSTFTFDVYSGAAGVLEARLKGVGAATKAITDCATWPNNVCNNSTTAPTFATNPAGVTAGTRTKSQFALSGTVGVGDATHLTTTTDGGTADTTLTFADPYYFYAGADPLTWDLGYFGETGDDVCVGATAGTTATNAQLTRIQAINYGTGVVTVAPGVDHVNGSKVWKAEQDASSCAAVWDNRGAVQ